MEFRVLGPLEVIGDHGSPITVPGRVRPRVLVVLLVENGRIVSASELIEAVWDGDAPATADRQLRNSIPLLRKVIGDRIERVAAGYRVRIDDDASDLRRFRRSAIRARQLRHSEGNEHEALSELQFGLSLWRGDVLSGIPGRYFTVAASNLEEERLTALEDRIELELALGEHSSLVPELRGLTAEHPHRQRMTGQLMVALHRDGRTAAALEMYQKTRKRLDTALGLEPGRFLKDLHGAILRDDPELYPIRQSVAASPSHREEDAGAASDLLPVPAQLPADTADFTGRHQELEALDALVASGSTAAAIAGAGGAGKTALALHWAHRHRDEFPDGQLYINLRGFDHAEPVSAHTALKRFLTSLGLAGAAIPNDLDDAAALFRSMVADRRMLVIIDNATDASQVRPLLPGGAGNFAIVTSRNTLTSLSALNSTALLNVHTLRHTESLELLGKLLGNSLLEVERDTVERLAHLCGDLPLALRIAAANLASHPHMSLTEYVAALESENRLDLLAVDGDPSAVVASTFEHSYRALEPETRRLFLRLGTLPGEDFADGLVAQVAGLTITTARTHLNRLRTAHLIEQHRSERHRFHDLIRLYASRQAEHSLEEDARIETVDRYIAWHHDRALTLPLADTVNLVAAISALSDHPRVWHLAVHLQAVVYAGQVPTQTRQLIETGLRQAERNGDRGGRSQMTGLLGAWHSTMGDVETALAHCRRALSLSAGESLFTNGLSRGNLGATLFQRGAFREAESVLLEAWEIAETLETVVWQQATDYYLANLYGLMGEFEKAFHYLGQAEALRVRESTTNATVINRLSRARLLRDTGRLDAAETAINAVANDVHIGSDNRARCVYLSVLGDLSASHGNGVAAREAFDEMRSVSRQHGLSFSESEAATRLAIVLNDLGQNDAARETLEPLLHNDIRHQGPRIAAEVALASAVVGNGFGSYASALRQGTSAVAAFGRMPYPLKQGQSLLVVAESHHGLGHSAASDACRRRALELLTTT